MTSRRAYALGDAIGFSPRRFFALLVKEWRQMKRDASSFIIAVLLPAALILLFGFGLSMDLQRVPSAVVLGESTPMTREIAARFTGSAYFDTTIVPTRQAAEDLMRRQLVDVIVELPQGLAQKTAAGAGEISLTIHGVDASAAMIIRTYASAALADFLARREAREDALAVIGASSEGLAAEAAVSAAGAAQSAAAAANDAGTGSDDNRFAMPLRPLSLGTVSSQSSRSGAADSDSAEAARSENETLLEDEATAVSASSAGALPGTIVLETRAWFNEANKSAWYLVPGLTIVVMTLTCSFMGSIVIAREWERGTMESLCTTRATPLEILSAKLCVNYGFSTLGLLLCLALARLVFEVPVRGDFGYLIATLLIYNLWAMSFGLFLSAATKRQFVAIQMAVIGSYLPALILSGYLFDLRSVPDWIAWVGHLMPPTYAIESVKILCLSGGSDDIVRSNAALLAAWSTLFFGLALNLTRKRLD